MSRDNPYYKKFFEWLDNWEGPHPEALDPGDLEKIKAKLEWIIDQMHPLTKKLYGDLPKEEQRKYQRPRVTGTHYGLDVAADHSFVKAIDAELALWDRKIRRVRQIDREEAGWSDEENAKGQPQNTYLIDPMGNRNNPMGFPYGAYTQPAEAYNYGGIWNHTKDGLAGVRFST